MKPYKTLAMPVAVFFAAVLMPAIPVNAATVYFQIENGPIKSGTDWVDLTDLNYTFTLDGTTHTVEITNRGTSGAMDVPPPPGAAQKPIVIFSDATEKLLLRNVKIKAKTQSMQYVKVSFWTYGDNIPSGSVDYKVEATGGVTTPVYNPYDWISLRGTVAGTIFGGLVTPPSNPPICTQVLTKCITGAGASIFAPPVFRLYQNFSNLSNPGGTREIKGEVWFTLLRVNDVLWFNENWGARVEYTPPGSECPPTQCPTGQQCMNCRPQENVTFWERVRCLWGVCPFICEVEPRVSISPVR